MAYPGFFRGGGYGAPMMGYRRGPQMWGGGGGFQPYPPRPVQPTYYGGQYGVAPPPVAQENSFYGSSGSFSYMGSGYGGGLTASPGAPTYTTAAGPTTTTTNYVYGTPIQQTTTTTAQEPEVVTVTSSHQSMAKRAFSEPPPMAPGQPRFYYQPAEPASPAPGAYNVYTETATTPAPEEKNYVPADVGDDDDDDKESAIPEPYYDQDADNGKVWTLSKFKFSEATDMEDLIEGMTRLRSQQDGANTAHVFWDEARRSCVTLLTWNSREEALDGIKKNAEDFRKMFASVGVDLPFDSHAPFLASTHAICPGF